MRKSYLAAVTVFTLASATAMAQDATTQNDTTKTNPPATMISPPSTTTTPEKPNLVMPSGTLNFINVKSDDKLSSNIVGLDIYNDQNNDIGKISRHRLRQFEADDGLHPVGRRLSGNGNALRCG